MLPQMNAVHAGHELLTKTLFIPFDALGIKYLGNISFKIRNICFSRFTLQFLLRLLFNSLQLLFHCNECFNPPVGFL